MKIRVRVGPSRIAGQGLFAGQAIKQGTKIIRYIGQKITQEESDRRLAAGNVYIFGLDERYAIDGAYAITGSVPIHWPDRGRSVRYLDERIANMNPHVYANFSLDSSAASVLSY